MTTLRLLRQVARTFSTSSRSHRDLVQELYLRELKGYKAPPVAKDAHIGAVKIFSQPQVPKPPVLPADLATQLAAYDTTEPAKADDVCAAIGVESVGQGAEAFLSFLEADVKQPEAHH